VMLNRSLCRGLLLSCSFSALTLLPKAADSQNLALVHDVEWQPLAASIRRLIDATDYLGAPFKAADKQALLAALDSAPTEATDKIQEILDQYCLFGVNINPESRVKVAAGPAQPELVEQGWRSFLVKVQNDAGVTAELQALSPNAQSLFEGGGY